MSVPDDAKQFVFFVFLRVLRAPVLVARGNMKKHEEHDVALRKEIENGLAVFLAPFFASSEFSH